MDDADVYEKYSDELIRFAAALVGPSGAEDLLANAMLKSFRSLHWDAVDNKRAYLYRVVWTEAHQHRRSVRRRLRREMRAAPHEAVDPTTVDRDVLNALQRLASRERAVVYLTYWIDMPTAEIADFLQVAPRTVERDLTNARRTLKELLT